MREDSPQSSQRCDGFAHFAVVLKKRGRSRWTWAVNAATGQVLMWGSEHTRAEARYKADRALFLLLCSSASRHSKAPAEGPELLARAEMTMSEARQRRHESRAAIAKLRGRRKALRDSIEKLRLAHQAVMLEAESARLFMRLAAENLKHAADHRPPVAIKAPSADP